MLQTPHSSPMWRLEHFLIYLCSTPSFSLPTFFLYLWLVLFCVYYILNKPGKLPAPQLLYRPPVGQVLSRFPSKKDFKKI